MGRRNSSVASATVEEDTCHPTGSKSNDKKQKSTPSRTSSNSKESKKLRISSPRSRLRRDNTDVVDGWNFSGLDFSEIFYGHKVSAANCKEIYDPGRSNTTALWVDKYKPRCLEELAVHKKKVQEVKLWFEETWRSPPEDNFKSHVLIINGQPGVGKSTTIHVLASHFGVVLSEWNAPTPTIWKEHIHNVNAGINYTSKLDEFLNFIEKVRKYGMVPSFFFSESRPSIMLLVDDIPLTHGRAAFERLQNSLLLLVTSTRIPTVVLFTDCVKVDSSYDTDEYLDELHLSLVNAGACKVTFNPITNNSIKKALARICREEQCSLTDEQLDLVAAGSGGDIRYAITSLQLCCINPVGTCNSPSSNFPADHEISGVADGFSSLFKKDESLSLFHALGKFLHNKREAEPGKISEQDEVVLKRKFCRLPLKMDVPEKVLQQAHGQARSIVDFLYENVLDFISDDGIEDAHTVASYLSDADLLLCSFGGISPRSRQSEEVLQSAAASVAARGVLYGNSHPAPSRWHAIRKPMVWQVERSVLSNQKCMKRQRFCASSWDSVMLSIVYVPHLKWLANRVSDYCEYQSDEEEEEEEDDDDDIEDC